MRKLFTYLALFLLCFSARAQEAMTDSLFLSAVAAYSEEKVVQARQLFEQLYVLDPEDTSRPLSRRIPPTPGTSSRSRPSMICGTTRSAPANTSRS